MKALTAQADSLDQSPPPEDVPHNDISWSEEEEKVLRRKLDMQIVPMVIKRSLAGC